MSKLSERMVVDEFSRSEELSHFVVRFAWSRWFNSEYRKHCEIELEVFCNKMFGNVVKNYSRGSKIVCWVFWEMGRGTGLHAHCLVGWPTASYRVSRLVGLTVEESFRVNVDRSRAGCSRIKAVWFDEERAGERVVEYCMKELVENHNVTGMERVALWRGGRVPEYVKKYWNEGVI